MASRVSILCAIPLITTLAGAASWEVFMGPLGGAVAKAQSSGRIIVEVSGFRNETGDALFGLFRGEAGFPEEPLKAERRIAAPIQNGRAVLQFDDVEPGSFAISVLHDEDRNRELRTGALGIPREGIGFSRDARGTFGPPKYKNAKIALESGQTLTITIHMKYY